MIHVIHEAVRWDSRALFSLFLKKVSYYGTALPKCYIKNLVFVKKLVCLRLTGNTMISTSTTER